MAKVTIAHHNIARNVAYVRSQTELGIIAVVKNNAYNTGLLKSCEALYQTGVKHFFVTEINEAIAVKTHFNNAVVIVMNTLDNGELALARQHGLQVSLNSYPDFLARADQYQDIPIHLNVNSGMNRYGVAARDQLITICQSPLNLVGIYTHFALAEEDDLSEHLRQVDHFNNTVEMLLKLRQFDYIHAANSATFARTPNALKHCNYVRLGIMLMGYSSVEPISCLSPTVYVKGRIVERHSLSAGDYIGYGFEPVIKDECTIAIVDIGYGHGILRPRVNYPVYINGRIYPILKMSMSHTFIIDDGRLNIGDSVEFYGNNMRVDLIKDALGLTNSYQMAMLNEL